MKAFLIVFGILVGMGIIITIIIKLTDYFAHKEFLSLKVGDALQQYETISYEEWMSGSEDVTQNIGNPRKIVNVSGDKQDRIIVLEDGTRLTWDLYKDYEFDIIIKDS